MTRGARDPFRDHDPFLLYVFVPAIMSAGLLFSIATLLRDAIAARGRNRARRLAELDAAGTVAAVLGTGPDTPILRSRRFYALIGLSAIAMAGYVIPGAAFNYLRPNGYVADIAWLLCLALAIGLALVVIGVAGVLGAVEWPVIRPSIRWLAASGPAGAGNRSEGDDTLPSPRLGVAILVSVAGLTFVTVGVAVGRFRYFDRELAEWVRDRHLPWIVDVVAGMGSTPISLLLATAIGAVAVRCRTFAMAWIGTVAASFATDFVLKRLVERGRPPGFAAGLEDSFPSGHLVQLVLLAVAVPLAWRVVGGKRWTGAVLGAALLVGAALGGFERVHTQLHWPTDVLAGVALGLTAGLVLRWIVLHGTWHRRCHRCPWRGGGSS